MGGLGMFWSGLTQKNKISFSIALFILIIGLGSGFYWLTKVESALLYSNLDEQETANIVTKLKEMGIEHSFSEDGSSIYVNESLVHSTRYDLISNGISLQNSKGFELFDTADFGLTEFAQKINYQRALEGETARTITSFDSVKSARVHLSLPKSGTLRLNKEKPKASVTLVLHSGSVINKKQINGIKALVASAVTGLTTDNVNVIGRNGVSFIAGNSESVDISAIDERLKYKRDVEAGMKSKLSTILIQLFGEKSSNVAIDITFNFDKIVKTINDVKLPDNKNSLIKRKETKHSEISNKRNKNGGNSSDHELEEEYIYGSETIKKELSVGRIERITVAVALTTMITSEEKNNLKKVMSAAIGLKPSRGDLIEVEVFNVQRESETKLLDSPVPTKPEYQQDIVSSSNKVTTVSNVNENLLDYISTHISIISFLILLVIACSSLIFLILHRRLATKAMSKNEKETLLLDVQTWLELADGPIRTKEFCQ